MTAALVLTVVDYAGPARWRWRLSTAGGAVLATHEVTLDTDSWEFDAFVQLDDYIRRHTTLGQRIAGDVTVVDDLGRWIGTTVLGRVGEALVEHRPTTVVVDVPAAARFVAYRPLELAVVRGRMLSLQNVTLVWQIGEVGVGGGKRPVADRLRVLGLFSMPDVADALNLRRERHNLARLMHEIATVHERAVDLRILQYGVTRKMLREVAEDGEGWDIVHISGHGLAGGLLLERDDGTTDQTSTTELADLLEPLSDRVKLATISTCSSAAATAAEHLQLLGLVEPTPQARAADQVDGPGTETSVTPTPALAEGLVGRLGCAVVAMRFPVPDDFAIRFADRFYELLIARRQPLARAVGLALPKAIGGRPGLGATAATPTVFGALGAHLTIDAPDGPPVVFAEERLKLRGFPPQPNRFVGRVGVLARANGLLAPRSGRTGIMLHGMPGAGKTTCALELAYGHQHDFQALIWHKAPDEGQDVTGSLSLFALSLEGRLPGLRLADLLDDGVRLRRFLPALTEFCRTHRILVVLDNVESLLSRSGDWLDPRWKAVVDALTAHDGLSRVIMTTRRRPSGLGDRVRAEAVHALSRDEAVLLARELPNLGPIVLGTAAGIEQAAGWRLVARALTMAQGHPKLLELADGQAANPRQLNEMLDEASAVWDGMGTVLADFFTAGESHAGEQEFTDVLRAWTRSVVDRLPQPARTLFHFLCALEEIDRIEAVVEDNWSDLWEQLRLPVPPPDPYGEVDQLVTQGLVEVGRETDGQILAFSVHPAIAAAGRDGAGVAFQEAVDREVSLFWCTWIERSAGTAEPEEGRLIVHAARAAVPYLIRLEEWRRAAELIGEVQYRDKSRATAAAVLPSLRHVLSRVRGTPDELSVESLVARGLEAIDRKAAEELTRKLVSVAIRDERHGLASALLGDLVHMMRPDEALSLVEAKAEQTALAGYGPWTRLGDDVTRLQILVMRGEAEHALSEVNRLRAGLDGIGQGSDEREVVEPWIVVEGLLEVGARAAADLEQWARASELLAEALASKRDRSAPELDAARTAAQQYLPLLRMGQVEQARALLAACRDVFERADDPVAMGTVLRSMAEVEAAAGELSRSVATGREAMRYLYVARDADQIAAGHHALGDGLAAADDPAATAHHLAAATLRLLIGARAGDAPLEAVTGDQAAAGPVAAPVPQSIRELGAVLRRSDGHDFAAVLAAMQIEEQDAEKALCDVLDRTAPGFP